MKRTIIFFLILLSPFYSTISAQTAQTPPILSIDTGGHKALVRDVLFTSDGKYLVSASDDKTVRVWNVETGEPTRVIRGFVGEGHEGKVFAAALSKDDKLLAVAGWMGPNRNYDLTDVGTIRLIDFRTGEIMGLLKGHQSIINGLAFSPSGKYLVSGSADKTAIVWDVRTQKTVHVLEGHTDIIYTATYSPDEKTIVTGSDDDTVKLWNASGGKLIKTLKGHTNDVRSVKFTPDGRYLLTAGWDRSVRMWDGKTGNFIKVIATQDRDIESITITPDGKNVLTGYGQGKNSFTNYIYSISSGNTIQTFSENSNVVVATAISPDGRTAATAGAGDNEIYLWDTSTGEVKQRLSGKGRMIWNVGFSKDGRKIAWGKSWDSSSVFSYGPIDQSFILSDITGELMPGKGPKVTNEDTWKRTISSRGPFSLRTPNYEKNKTLEILKNGSVQHKITRTSSNGFDHYSLTLTPDGLTVISGGASGFLASYDPETGQKIHEFTGHTGVIWGVSVSPDSRFLVSGSDDQTVKLWHIASGKLLLSVFEGTDGEWAAWTPAGYYTSSLKGGDYIGWHLNRGYDRSALYYPGSRFARKFYSPETVAAYIQTAGDIDQALEIVNASKSTRNRIDKTQISDIEKILPPVVYFKLPADTDSTVEKGEVRIKAAGKSLNQEPITDIWVLVNGKRPDKNRGITLKKNKVENFGLRAEIDITVPLTQKENRISVIAKNRFTQSEPELINVVWNKSKPSSAQKDIYKPNLYILSIGVSDYMNKDLNLDVAAADAIGVASALQKQQGRLYNQVKTKLLTNDSATKDDILDGLDWIMSESTQKDLSIIFIAGHGMKDGLNNYYFLSHDSNPEKLRRTAVKWLEFDEIVTNLPSKTILLADTCHSGSITGKRRGVSDITDALRDLVNADTGVVVMTASTGNELSVEKKEWGHGAFTKALIEGLNGKANYNNDRQIDLKELDLYITERVKDLTDGTQHPTTEIPKTLPNFPIAFQ